MFNRTSEECVFLEIQKGKLFSLQTLLPEITTRTLPPSDRSTTNVPLCQHFSACAHSQAKDVVGLDFIQCPFPNQIQFGLEKLHPKIAYNFPNQFQFGLERKKLILQDADSKPNSDWFGKFWWPLSMSWKFQTKFSLVWKNHWLLPTPWTLNQFQ